MSTLVIPNIVNNAPGGGGTALSASVTAAGSQEDLALFTTTVTPAGGTAPYTYATTLYGPPGSAASAVDGTTSTPDVTPDVPGLYVLSILVTDSSPTPKTARVVRAQSVGNALGYARVWSRDFTQASTAAISGASTTDGGVTYGVVNDANATTFTWLNGTGLRIIQSATGTLSGSVRTVSGITVPVATLAPSYGEGKGLLVMLRLGTGCAVGASQRAIGLSYEDPVAPIGDGGTTERGCGITWRNSGGARQVAGVMAGLSSGTGLTSAAYPIATTAPRVLALEVRGYTCRIWTSDDAAAYQDTAHASWTRSDFWGVDYDATPLALDPDTAQLFFYARADAGGAGAQFDLEQLSVYVKP